MHTNAHLHNEPIAGAANVLTGRKTVGVRRGFVNRSGHVFGDDRVGLLLLLLVVMLMLLLLLLNLLLWLLMMVGWLGVVRSG